MSISKAPRLFETASQIGIANTVQLDPITSACISNGQNVTTTDNGLQFLVNCDTNIINLDVCDNSAPFCRSHAASLDECIEYCSTFHPLCTAVVWNWNQQNGFTNCYPKSGSTSLVDKNIVSLSIAHSATARIIPGTDDCAVRTNKTFEAQNGAAFQLTCEEERQGNNTTIQHVEKLDSCINSCADYHNGSTPCVGVVFDSYLTNGYENCYLKSSVGTASPNRPGSTFAVLEKASSLITNSTTDSSTVPSRRSSKAWIAAPVVLSIALVASFAVEWWWYNYKNRSKEEVQPGRDPVSDKELAPSHKIDPVEMEGGLSLQEMGGSDGAIELAESSRIVTECNVNKRFQANID